LLAATLVRLGIAFGENSDGLNANADRMIPWKIDSLKKAPKVFPEPEIKVEGLESFYFEGLPLMGKPTKVFAFYGRPQGIEGKVPGIVLVHGGGGTAYADWVKLWVSRGYAAIAFDHNGGFPIRNESGNGWKRNPNGGPGMGAINQITMAPTDQWMYHAVADTMLAVSLLASFPEVDASRIGITGISWGGVITCTVAGLDDRLKFAVPVYGSGFISHDFDDGSRFVGIKDPMEKVDRWRELWDPSHYLPNAKLPMLWVDGTNDFAFTLRAVQLSYRSTKCPRVLSTHPRMVHGQKEGAAPLEIGVFADSVVRGGVSLARITGQGTSDGEAWVQYQSEIPISSATLNYTSDHGLWQKRLWESLPAKIDEAQHRVSARVPQGVTAWFLNLKDKRGLIVSSEHEVTKSSGEIGSQ
jgi:dienelactone hydrolase